LRVEEMRTGAFEFGVVAALLAAAAVFAAATVGALALGHEQVALRIGSAVLYRFINEPGMTEVHVGPAVFLMALIAGVGRILMMRTTG
jgi:hypothetical protein